MTRRKIQRIDFMTYTEKLLLELGYGGFNFSVLSKQLGVGRSTIYEYYASKDELIVDYMQELMENYINELSAIVAINDAETQLIRLIELMVKYAHIHNILKIIPLLQSEADIVQQMKDDFITDHIRIIKDIQSIIENGKEKHIIRKEIPTDILVNLLFNTINKPSSLKIDNRSWAKWIWEILYTGMKA